MIPSVAIRRSLRNLTAPAVLAPSDHAIPSPLTPAEQAAVVEAVMAAPEVVAGLAAIAGKPQAVPYGPKTLREHWAAQRLEREFARIGGAL